MEIGLASGLSQDFQYDKRIADARYNEQATQEMRARQQAIAEAKTKLMLDDLQIPTGATEYDQKVLGEITRNKVKELSQITREHPDVLTNLDAQIATKLKKNEIMNNPWTINAATAKGSIDKLKADMAEAKKNPNQWNQKALDEEYAKAMNYSKFGHPTEAWYHDPKDAVAYVYQRPKDFIDINQRWMDIGNKFGDKKTRPIVGGRNAYEEYANPETLRRVAEQEYIQNKDQYDIEAAKHNINPVDYIKMGIDAHIPKKKDFGDYGLNDAITLANYKHRLDGLDRDVAPNKSAYQEAFVKAKDGVVNPTFLEQTYGPKPKNEIYSNKQDVKFDNTGNRVYYTGNHKWLEGKNGKQKVVEVYSYLTPEEAKQKGIYDDGNWNPFQGEEISPDWNKQAEVVTTGEGDKTKKMIKVKAFMPVELNEAYAGAFDNEVHIAKSKLMGTTPNEGGGPQIGQEQDGYKYIGGDPASPNSWKKL
jgi:hypothetical protein